MNTNQNLGDNQEIRYEEEILEGGECFSCGGQIMESKEVAYPKDTTPREIPELGVPGKWTPMPTTLSTSYSCVSCKIRMNLWEAMNPDIVKNILEIPPRILGTA